MKRAILLFACLAFFAVKNQAQSVTDYDGNIYDTISIGSQVWLKQNLKVTHYRNGLSIPNVIGGTAWSNLTTGARCYYNNDSATYDSVFGALYNWYAVNNNNEICPSGWHVPTDGEWTILETYLGGSTIAGGKMKEAGILHWLSPNTGATNSSGFTGLPGGMLGTTYSFQTINENGLWWTSSQQSGGAWSRYLWYLNAGVDRNITPKTIGLSIRCIRDVHVGMEITNPTEKVRLYPTPAGNSISVDLKGNLNVTLLVYRLTGEIVMQSDLTNWTNVIDISALANGIYFVKVSCDKWTVVKKLVKE
jgi:uncharacterized protein (TIGR02145 family)